MEPGGIPQVGLQTQSALQTQESLYDSYKSKEKKKHTWWLYNIEYYAI